MKVISVKRVGIEKQLRVFGHTVFRFWSTRRRLRELWAKQEFLFDRESIFQRYGFRVPMEADGWWTGRFEIVELALADLFRYGKNSQKIPFGETSLVKYLVSGNEEPLHAFYRNIVDAGWFSAGNEDVFVANEKEALSQLNVRGPLVYDPTVCCIVVDGGNVIVDGCHRAAILWKQHGPMFRVKVVRCLPLKD